jgi:hypothetical protein
MIPKTIKFTSGEIDPAEIFDRFLDGPMPLEWMRQHFVVTDHDFEDPTPKVKEWIERNLDARYTVNAYYCDKGYTVVLGFESVTDAVMFRMVDGHTKWREPKVQIF